MVRKPILLLKMIRIDKKHDRGFNTILNLSKKQYGDETQRLIEKSVSAYACIDFVKNYKKRRESIRKQCF